MQTETQTVESSNSVSPSWQLLDQHAYDCLSNTVWFIEQHVIHNHNLPHLAKAVLMHYVMQHPGVWNNPSDIIGLKLENHRVTIAHTGGQVLVMIPELAN